MKRRTKIILLILIILSGLFLLRLINQRPVEEKQVTLRGAVEKVTVKVAQVKKADLNLILSYVGNIKAKDETYAFSKVTGKLVEYAVNEGDKIEKGGIIAFVDRDETGLKYELAKVESPISGIVGRTLLDKGASILPSASIIQGTPLAIIVNMDEMIVKLNIPEADIPSLKKGLKAMLQVDAYPEEPFIGEVSKVSEVVDPQTRTLPIEINIPNPGHKLKSGMFARIKIIAAQLKGVLVLHQDAIIQEMGEKFAFLVKNNIADKRKVILGKRDDGKIEILEGIREGDEVIVFGQQGLKDGASVVVSKE